MAGRTAPGASVAVRAAGRGAAAWSAQRLADCLEGAGFTGVAVARTEATAVRDRSLADSVRPGLRLLCVGLNPSLVSADAGVGYVGATNRFWPAAVAAGLVPAGRDVDAALAAGVGITDLVKRATARAASLEPAEYQAGAARVERLVRWLRPDAVAFVGLTGYRAAVDRRAAVGHQPVPFGGRPAYVLPSTSGANAHATLGVLVDHLRAAADHR
jgi:TDG/mug DNA glycosylase family protein